MPIFRQLARRRGTLVDVGCGPGRAAQKLSDARWQVWGMDFAENCLDDGVEIPFLRQDITRKWPQDFDYAYCCDVMEHLPPQKVDRALKRIVAHVERAFFSIHFGPDNFGQTVGHPLHLTIQPFAWWRDKLREYGELRDARDLLGMGTFYLVQ